MREIAYVLKTWLRRFLGVGDSVETPSDTRPGHEQRIAALEEDLDFLRGELRRLRGRVTGGLRAPESPQDAPGDTNGPPPGVGVSPQTWARLDPAARERLITRRSRGISHG